MSKEPLEGAERDAWQRGYDLFRPEGEGGIAQFNKLREQLPANLQQAAFDGWTAAIAEYQRGKP